MASWHKDVTNKRGSGDDNRDAFKVEPRDLPHRQSTNANSGEKGDLGLRRLQQRHLDERIPSCHRCQHSATTAANTCKRKKYFSGLCTYHFLSYRSEVNVVESQRLPIEVPT